MKKLKISEDVQSFLFVLPALVIFVFFYVIPFFYTFWLAFHRGSGIGEFTFVGLANFKKVIFQDKLWWNSVKYSFYITLWALTFQNALAFMLALAVDKAIRTGNIYRVIFFLLPIISEIIFGLLVRKLLLYDPGVFNHLLEKIGLGRFTHDWLGDPKTALTCLAITHCWRGFGWGFIILLAGLQSIPTQLYEAARIDGANAIQRFTKITLPLMIPVVCLVVILTVLGTVQVIGLPMALTRGGPAQKTTVAVYRIYNELNNYHLGYASTEGIILGVILIVISFTLLSISRRLKRD